VQRAVKTSHSETRTQIDYPYGQTDTAVNVSHRSANVIIDIGVYTWHAKKYNDNALCLTMKQL